MKIILPQLNRAVSVVETLLTSHGRIAVTALQHGPGLATRIKSMQTIMQTSILFILVVVLVLRRTFRKHYIRSRLESTVFIGNVLRYMTRHGFYGGTPEENLNQLMREIKLEYKRQRTTTRYNNITHNMVHPPNKPLPFLKGKAAEVKCFIPVLAVIFQRAMNLANQQQRDMIDGIDASARIDAILHGHKRDYRLPAPVAREFREQCFRLAQCQHALIKCFHPAVALFNNSIKTHVVLHLGVISGFINPTAGSCWMGEDLQRTARRLIQASSVGLWADKVQEKTMDRYVHALNFDLQTSEESL